MYDSEVQKFDSLAESWWNQDSGPHKLLHKLNPLRVEYICQRIAEAMPNMSPDTIKVLDVGCGGGLVTESLARFGFCVDGVDESEASIRVARQHASEADLAINYSVGGIAHLTKTYDVVVCLEVIEHVDDVDVFLKQIWQRLNVGGIVILSTINRTFFSYGGAILWAEKIARVVPNHLHDWNKFIKPHEILQKMGLQHRHILHMQGYTMNPLSLEWSLTRSLAMNYFMTLAHEESRASNLPAACKA